MGTENWLKGHRVVELASVLAGPSVGMFFAELGAEVIKIENPRTGGDVTRKWKLPTEDPNSATSAYFCSVNWGKQHLFLDLKTEEGRQQVYELVKTADLVVSNYKPGDDRKLLMDYDTLRQYKPDLIYGHITGYGDDDPRAAFDVALQAETGYMYMNGTPETAPLKMPLAMIDILAAHQLKEGMLLALLKKGQTGQGAYITASLFDAAISALTNQASNWLMGKHLPQRIGSKHPNIAPYGDVLFCKGKKPIVLAVGSDQQFIQLCNILEVAHLVQDERFSTNPSRVIHREALIGYLQQKAIQFERELLLKLLDTNKVPVGAIYNMEEVFEMPAAQGMILSERLDSGEETLRPKGVAFNIKL